MATITFQPEQAELMTQKVMEIADELAQRGASSDDLERLRRPRLAKVAEHLRDNLWWLRYVVSVAQTRPEVIDEARRYESSLRELALDDLNSALRAFRQQSVTAVVARPFGDAADLLSGAADAGAAGKDIEVPRGP